MRTTLGFFASIQTMDITTGIFGFFILCCAYSAQYWAKKCHDELKAIRNELTKGS